MIGMSDKIGDVDWDRVEDNVRLLSDPYVKKRLGELSKTRMRRRRRHMKQKGSV